MKTAAKIVTSDVPFERTQEGAYILDVDADSFRVILSILKGRRKVKDLKMNDIELGLLKSTADYLMLRGLKEALEAIVTARQEKIDDLNNKISILDKEINDLKTQYAEKDDQAEEAYRFMKTLKGMQCSIFECMHYPVKYHSGNYCHSKSLVIGDGFKVKKEGEEKKLVCMACGRKDYWICETGQSGDQYDRKVDRIWKRLR